MLSDGDLNLAHAAADSADSAALYPTSPKGEVPAQPGVGALAFSSAFPTDSPAFSTSSSSHPTSHIRHPTSAAAPRRAVPLSFNPIINDEANILAAISRGSQTLFDLAEEHGTTVSNLCIWLQREDIQQKLNDLSTCGAQITRVAAVNQLPKAVKAMAFQIEAHIFDRTHNLIKPGLAADKISALRDANARKACNLLLRLARFDPSLPLYRAPKLLPRQGEVAAQSPEGARSPGPDGGAVEQAQRRETEGALLLPSTPAPQPDLLSLCAAALAAAHDARESSALDLSDSEGRGWRGNREVPAAISILSNDPARRLPVENQNHKHNGHTNGRVVRHTKSSESPPKSRPPPSH